MNIRGTKKVIELCKKLKSLDAFVHVSTAYANCDRKCVEEIIYEPPAKPDELLNFIEWISDDTANKITPHLIHPRPNTYTYTKAIAESLVVQECLNQVPCTIVRPSIVSCAWKEPMPGWIDNLNGPTGLFVAYGKGALRSLLADSKCVTDFVPVEYPINMMIVAGWEIGRKASVASMRQDAMKEIKVYHSTTGDINRLTWGMVSEYGKKCCKENPFEPFFVVYGEFTSNRYKLK